MTNEWLMVRDMEGVCLGSWEIWGRGRQMSLNRQNNNNNNVKTSTIFQFKKTKKKVKISVSCVNAHRWPQQRKILTIKWIPSAFPKSPHHCPMGYEQGGCGGKDGLPLTKVTAECPSVSSRDQHWAPYMVSFPRVISQLPGNRLMPLDHFHHGSGSVLFLLE